MAKKTQGQIRRAAYFPLEFPISRARWEFYGLDKGILPERGEIRMPDFRILRELVKRIYERKDLAAFSRTPLRAGQLNAAGLINEIYRYLILLYCTTKNPPAFRKGLRAAREKITAERLDGTIAEFVELFPPHTILRGKESIRNYLRGKTKGIPHRQIVATELLLLALGNSNPAFSPMLELFSDADLAQRSAYPDLFSSLEQFFQQQPGFGPAVKPLVDFMREPILAAGDSLQGQLTYIKDHWRALLPEQLFYRLLTAIDILREEEKLGLMGQGPNLVLRFKDLDASDLPEWARLAYAPEYERLTEDRAWMAQVVIIAKSTYVWLDQLSKKYGRPITRLDQIPDEELDILARWGFTGLWLIGVWERSSASRKIKHICGNQDALASAYSLYDYEISNDLGGEQAFLTLKERAWARGIRLGTDIVPNHMGIYSKWVIEHPERFVQLDHPPFPGYRFTGPELSDDPRVSLQIEDGYWSRRDAAVVFMRRDRWTGNTKYIYHGNDGTSMPWNDTAQLNFLREDVREAVIQLILGVARHFQIIRFDAAMTLAKRHFQRLWFPHPGTGGGIPSRAEHGMFKDDFEKLMPREFWREVVDRINKEMPDTLLLAEAFWLMEGYFVRTLGMHRVYNSAFMNMLKTEENDKYRSVVKNVLEFDPRILKRFVNFMNNPDEQTAVAQFGAGDKYFGICLMMVTMPGLPMFGHGQIEGFHEKYGMEYRRAYWNETPDWNLVRRHEAEIFPLMKKRHLFSEVKNFVLYDFYTPGGQVNENVFAYSNRCGSERALIVYHNKYEETSGWIRTSCGMAVDYATPKKKRVVQTTLADALGIQSGADYYYIFKDYKGNLEYIRSGRELAKKGLFTPLRAFQYCIFLDFREVRDSRSGYYRRLTESLNGRGVPSMEEALKEMIFAPIHTPFRKLVGAEMLDALLSDPARARRAFKSRTGEFLSTLKAFLHARCDERQISDGVMEQFDALLKLREITKCGGPAAEYLASGMADERGFWGIALIWLITRNLGKVRGDTDCGLASSALLDELLLGKAISRTIQEHGSDAWSAAQLTALIKILTEHHAWCDPLSADGSLDAIAQMFHEADVRLYLNVNRYDNVFWFSRERMERFLYWLLTVSVVDLMAETRGRKEIMKEMDSRYGLIARLLKNAEESGWQVEKFLALLPPPSTAAPPPVSAPRR